MTLFLLSIVATVGPGQGTTADLVALDCWNAAVEASISQPLPLRITYDGKLLNSKSFHLLLPPLTSLVMRCDPSTFTIADTLAPDYGLSTNAEAAVLKAPRWLRPDLVDNLMQLTASKQDVFADMILNPPDARLRDEIAFVVAHSSPSHLLAMNPSVVTQNVDSLLAIDEELEYVDIVDYGNPATDDDYYSTTRYNVLDTSGTPVTFELPRDIYYWYVIHPQGTDELPKIIYEKFWREFLYYDNGSVSYTEDGTYPLLRDELDTVTVAWGGEGNGAVGAVHRWVNGVMHWGATSPRPIQPIEIACDHDGNCGEYQDIKWAGGRTALLPYVGVLDINEDHVWCATWHPLDYSAPQNGGVWDPAQESAYDKDRGGSKYCSMIWQWRGDGYQYSAIENYSNSCTLSVTAYDTNGNPVPNSDVKLLSEAWQSLMRLKGFSGITDRAGHYTTTLGEEQNYYASVYMEGLGKIIDSAASVAGSRFSVSCTLKTNYKPQPRDLKIDSYSRFPIEGEIDTTLSPPSDQISYLVFFNNHAEMGEVISGTVSFAGSDLRLQAKAEYDLGHCPTYSYEEVQSQSAVQFVPGRLTDFIITDYDGVLVLGIEEPPQSPVSPELVGPALVTSESPCFNIIGCVEPLTVSVFDKLGRRIEETSVTPDASGAASFTWDGTVGQPSGVYFLRVSTGNRALVHKFVMLR